MRKVDITIDTIHNITEIYIDKSIRYYVIPFHLWSLQ